MAFESCLGKQERLKQLFLSIPTPEKKYEKVIELGRSLPLYSSKLMTEDKLVKGCQSLLYLHSELTERKVHFMAHSDALISAGLAALLLEVYEDEAPEALFKCPPIFLKEIGLFNLLTPSRSNGLKSLYIKMQQDAVELLKYS